MQYWQSNTVLDGIPFIKNAVSRRSSSYDKSGGNRDFWQVAAGDEATIADIQGAGSIKHIWLTTRCYDEMYLRKIIIEMYWDEETNPSVRVPLGDFFGIGHATCKHYVSLPMNMVFGKRRGPKGPFAAAMNCYFPMPFSRHATIKVINEADKPIENLFFMVDYDQTEEPMPEDVGTFHAQWRFEACQKKVFTPQIEHPQPWELPGKNLTGNDNYLILDAEGEGQYVGTLLNIDNYDASNQEFTWPGEGDDMIFIDGETWPPSLHGTGMEDYFGAAWGFPSGEYAGPYHGISLGADVQEHFGKWSLYRWHLDDPIRFKKSIRVTIEHGHANDQGNDYSSVAYWYQKEPHKALPELPPVEIRLPRRWPEHGLWDE